MIAGDRPPAALPTGGTRNSRLAMIPPAAILLCGGGSQANPLQQLLALLAGIVLLGVTSLSVDWRGIARQAPGATALLLALAALFLVQLAPLPGSLWPHLPGRALYAHGDMLMFGHPLDRPLSLDPGETLSAFLFLVPAFAVWLLTRHDRSFSRRFVYLYLAFLAASLALALAQLTAGPGMLRLYPTTHDRLPTGFFANRNHQAIAMVCGMPLAAALHRIERAGSGLFTARWAFAAALAGCVIGSLLTGSRTGAVLMLPALAAALAIGLGGERRLLSGKVPGRAIAAMAVLLLAALAIAVVAYRPGGALGLVFTRSLVSSDPRYAFWPVVIGVIRDSWPWGIGFGNFRYAFEVASTPSVLRPLYINHAHNDWLEFILEAGVGGLALTLAFLAWLFSRWLLARDAGEDRPLVIAAGTVIALLLAHSLSDYPLRTVALSACFAFCMGTLSPAPPSGAADRRRPSALRLTTTGLVALALGGMALDISVRTIAIRSGQTGLATVLPAPGSRLLSLHALQLAQKGASFGVVATASTRAVALSPLSEPAFAAAALASQDPAQSAALLAHAWQLSRRDPVVLAGWLRDAAARHDPGRAFAAIDALYRLQLSTPQRVQPLAGLLGEAAFRQEAVRVLAAPAPWRAPFIADLATIPVARPALMTLVRDLQGSPRPLTAEELQPAIANLSFGQAPDPLLAFGLWRQLAPAADALEWPDAPASRPLSPFDWALADSSSMSTKGATRRLEYDSETAPGVPVAAKRLPLKAGRYRVVIAASRPDAAVEVACGSVNARFADQALLELPADCPLADVRLFGGGRGWISSVRLIPAQ